VATVMAGEVLRIQAIAPGTAVVRARLGQIEQMITVTVSGEPVDPDTGPGESSSDGPGSETTGTASTDGSGTTEAGTTGGSTDASSGSSTAGGT
jgi:hypothetical protein